MYDETSVLNINEECGTVTVKLDLVRAIYGEDYSALWLPSPGKLYLFG